MLRVQNNVPLQHLRKVAEALSHLEDDLWTKTDLYVVNRRVVFVNPETGKPQEVVSGQYLLPIQLKKVIKDTGHAIESMRKRSNEQIGRITTNRAICYNAPVLAGTRIPVGAIKRLHEDGYSVKQIISEYPDLKPKDVRAALAYKPPKAA